MDLSSRRLLPTLLAATLVACGSPASTSRSPSVPIPTGTGTPSSPSSPATPASPTASPASTPTAEPATPDAPTPSPATPVPTSPSPSATAGSFALQPFAEGLSSPVSIAHAGDGSGALYVVEQEGRIRRVRADGSLDARPFLDITDRISAGGERGLLGLAFHPGFAGNRRLYVNYTDTNGDTRVSEFTAGRGGAAAVADPASERRLLFIDQPFPNHNGGALAFGPDGYLYVAVGDGGGGGDPLGAGQRRDTLLGKLLRVDVNAPGRYRVPADNPFVSAGGMPEIWAIGLRNPWRIGFDRATGDLWIADVGQGDVEEIDLQPGDAGGGLNYGWNLREGAQCYAIPDCGTEGLVDPVTQYTHDEGCTVIGGTVYRGRSVPALVGRYLFADYCSGTFWSVSADDARAALAARGQVPPEVALRTSDITVTTFGEDEAGEMYVADHRGGAILRIIPAEQG